MVTKQQEARQVTAIQVNNLTLSSSAPQSLGVTWSLLEFTRRRDLLLAQQDADEHIEY